LIPLILTTKKCFEKFVTFFPIPFRLPFPRCRSVRYWCHRKWPAVH